MKKAVYWITGTIILTLIAAYFVTKYNNSSVSIGTIDLRANCSDVTRLLITATVNVEVENLTSRPHEKVTVKISAFDKNGDFIKDRYTTFDRTLPPNGTLSKPVLLPAKTHTCSCEIVSSK